MSRRKTMDVERAREMRAEGMTWREVGIELAREAGRPICYQGAAVRDACSPTGRRLAKKLAREIHRA